MNEIKLTPGETIFILRRRCGMGQKALAKVVGINRLLLSMAERGDAVLPDAKLDEIERAIEEYRVMSAVKEAANHGG